MSPRALAKHIPESVSSKTSSRIRLHSRFQILIRPSREAVANNGRFEQLSSYENKVLLHRKKFSMEMMRFFVVKLMRYVIAWTLFGRAKIVLSLVFLRR